MRLGFWGGLLGANSLSGPADGWTWTRLLAKAGRVRYAVATGGNASWNSEARCRRSPALANRRRDYPYFARKTEGFRPCPSGRKAGAELESPFELPPVSFCSRPDSHPQQRGGFPRNSTNFLARDAQLAYSQGIMTLRIHTDASARLKLLVQEELQAACGHLRPGRIVLKPNWIRRATNPAFPIRARVIETVAGA